MIELDKPGSFNDFVEENPDSTFDEYSEAILRYRRVLSDVLDMSIDTIRAMGPDELASKIAERTEPQTIR